jgi:molecular chaperone GrpE
MTEERTAEGREPTEAEDSASVEAEVIDAEVVEEEDIADGDGVHAATSEGEPAVPADGEESNPLAEALRERDEYLALAQRARADFENYKRRASAQAAEAEQRGRATLARGLLPAIDNLRRALQAAGVDPADPGATDDALGKGVALVFGELLAALERDGVISFDPTGERFDPNLHEAISTAPAEGVEAGTVLETLEHGYRVDKQVIRPARVVVSG